MSSIVLLYLTIVSKTEYDGKMSSSWPINRLEWPLGKGSYCPKNREIGYQSFIYQELLLDLNPNYMQAPRNLICFQNQLSHTLYKDYIGIDRVIHKTIVSALWDWNLKSNLVNLSIKGSLSNQPDDLLDRIIFISNLFICLFHGSDFISWI